MIENIKHTILVKSIDLFKINGFESVTINQICETCGITKRTFYYHYDSKKSLLLDYFSLVDENIEITLKHMDDHASWLDKCWEIKSIYIRGLVYLNADILKNLIIIDMNQQNRMFSFELNDFDLNLKRLRQIVLDFTEKGQKAGEINDAFSAEELSYCFASAFLGLAVNWSSSGGNFDLVNASKKYFDMIYKK